MLHLFTGTDREKARSAMNVEIERVVKKTHADTLRITDAHTIDDLRAALQGPGMFGTTRILVLEGVFANEEMQRTLLEKLPALSKSSEIVFIYEEKPLAELRKKLETHAEKSVRYDVPKKGRDSSIFALANALSRGDKKTLWVEYQRALVRGDAPEAIHGVLFWGAKRMVTGVSRTQSVRARRIVAELSELPHLARRRGAELEYALERYILAVNKY